MPEYNFWELAGHYFWQQWKLASQDHFSVGHLFFVFAKICLGVCSLATILSFCCGLKTVKIVMGWNKKRKQLVRCKSIPLVGSPACLSRIQYGIADDEEE